VADSNGVITAMPARPAGNRSQNGKFAPRRDYRLSTEQGKSFNQLGGDYLHFTMYKENKDTMDAINTLARLLKIKASNFGFAGTKDRRASTAQRISVYRQREHNMIWLNSRLGNVKVGDFKHKKLPLQLGQHGGNEFVITIKNCQPLGDEEAGPLENRVTLIENAVKEGLDFLNRFGYLNYFGLQRFGTFSIGTHLLGMKILNGKYEGAINDILHVDEQYLEDVLENKVPQGLGPAGDNNRDDFQRAKAISIWKATKNSDKALEYLPKRFSSEAAIIRHLAKSPTDYMGAILTITRGMRMMYVHAYQSYVWNHVASRRWAKYGDKPIVGDLVLVTPDMPEGYAGQVDPVSGEEYDDDTYFAQARHLTAADISSGKYTIFDVVLPTPGFDVKYPSNEIGDFYAKFMGEKVNGGLDPYEMRRRNKEFSLSGNYRYVIGRFISEPEYAIRLYGDDTQQMYPTDLDICHHNKRQAAAANQKPVDNRRSSAPPSGDTAATMARWTHFSQNPAQYDGAMVAERRRKASSSPVPESVNLKETWVETGLDEDSKRVKRARHHESVTVENNAQVPSLMDVTVKVEDTFDSKSVDMKDLPSSSAMPAIGSTTAPMSVSDLYWATRKVTNGARTRLYLAGQTSSTETTPTEDVKLSLPKPAVGEMPNMKPDPADPLNWYGGSMPAVSAAPVATAAPPAAAAPTAKIEGAASLPAKIGKVTVPVFRKASDKTDADLGQEMAAYPDQKIAVVLKFQLKCSNYATVVLRELMGVEDGGTRVKTSPRTPPPRTP